AGAICATTYRSSSSGLPSMDWHSNTGAETRLARLGVASTQRSFTLGARASASPPSNTCGHTVLSSASVTSANPSTTVYRPRYPLLLAIPILGVHFGAVVAKHRAPAAARRRRPVGSEIEHERRRRGLVQ